MKRSALGVAACLAALTAIAVLLLAVQSAPAAGPEPGPWALARIDWAGAPETFPLPVHAVLQDARGQSYVLTLAPLARLAASGLPYRLLDRTAPPPAGADAAPGSAERPYLIALERRAGARARAAGLVDVLHDDGRQLIARASLAQTDALAALGLELAWVSAAPLVWPALLPAAVETPLPPDPWVAEMINQVDSGDVYTVDGGLSGEWPVIVGGSPYRILTRHTNSGQSIQNATQYVYERFQAFGLQPVYHPWTAGGYSGRNVIGVLTGTVRPSEIVIAIGHLDDMPGGGIAPGADDNASGSTGVLLAAEIMRQYRFERTVRFVLVTGEEQGLLGSAAYANYVFSRGDNIVAVYNMDMIAWDALGGPTLRIHTRTSGAGYQADLVIANVFTNVVNTYSLAGVLTPILDPDGISASDHYSFWQRGYPAVLAIEDDQSDFNQYYHTTNDRLANLNITYFMNYVKASVGTIAHLAYPLGPLGTPTPTVTGTPPTATPTRTATRTPTATACVPGQTDYGVTAGGASITPGVTDVGNHCDDCTTTIALPFPVMLYNQTFSTSITVSSNGTLQFTSSSSAFSNACLPDAGHNNTIFAYWDDLLTDGAGQGIFTTVLGSAPNRTFVVEWRAGYFSGGGTANFEVLLHEISPSFELVYGTVTQGNSSATAGVQRDTGSRFTQYACNGSGGAINNGLQLTFSLLTCGTPGATATMTQQPTATWTVLPSITPTPGLTGTPTPGLTGTPSATPTPEQSTATPTIAPPPPGVYLPLVLFASSSQ